MRRYRRLSAAFPIDVIDCMAGYQWDGSKCAPNSAGPTPIINLPSPSPVVTVPNPSGICPSWGCGYNPVSVATLCPPGYSWDGSGCVPQSVAPQGTIQTPAGPVSVTIDPTTGQPIPSIPPNGPLPPGAGYQQVEAPGSPYPYVYIGPGNQPQPNYGYPYTGSPTGLQPSQDPVYPNWNLQNPPAGSYEQSCSQIQSDGAGNLWAECANEAGVAEPTSLDYRSCVSAPYNLNGQLACGGPGGGQVSTPAATSVYGATPYPTSAVAPPWTVYTTYYPGQTASYAGATWTALAQSIGIPPGPGNPNWVMAGAQAGYGSPYPGSPYPVYGTSPYTPTVAQQTLQVPGRNIPAAPLGSSITSFFTQYKWWIIGGLAAAIVVPRVLPSHR